MITQSPRKPGSTVESDETTTSGSDRTQPAVETRPRSDFSVHHDQPEIVHGRLPADRYVRLPQHTSSSPGYPVAKDEDYQVLPDAASEAVKDGVALRLRRVLIGRPIASEHEHRERLGVGTGLPVFASDNISSSAYATEEIMRVLILAGVGALTLTLPITFAIVAVLAIVVISYQQTIAAPAIAMCRACSASEATAWPSPAESCCFPCCRHY